MSSYSEPVVVVFGGAGYIGSSLVPQLLDEGYRVRIFDNFLFGKDGIQTLEHPALEIMQGDICDTRQVSIAMHNAETVILLAAIVGHRVKEMKYSHYRDINLLASTTVLDAAIEHGASRFIFASTDSVYGVSAGTHYETDLPEPVSLYSRLKLRMEERIMRAKTRHFHPTALRICTCYGYSPRMRFDLLVNTLIRDAVCKKEVRLKNKTQCRPLVHVEDAAHALSSCVKAHVNMVSGEVFNVGSEKQIPSLQELAEIVSELVPGVKIIYGESEPDLVDYKLSCAKIEKILDFSPRRSISQSMEELQHMLQKDQFQDPYSLKYCNT